jgi:hypothetical protein
VEKREKVEMMVQVKRGWIICGYCLERVDVGSGAMLLGACNDVGLPCLLGACMLIAYC